MYLQILNFHLLHLFIEGWVMHSVRRRDGILRRGWYLHCRPFIHWRSNLGITNSSCNVPKCYLIFFSIWYDFLWWYKLCYLINKYMIYSLSAGPRGQIHCLCTFIFRPSSKVIIKFLLVLQKHGILS